MMAKKVVGLGFILLGGLAAAHGGSAGQTWEMSAGLFLLLIGAALLVLKVVRRNTNDTGQVSR